MERRPLSRARRVPSRVVLFSRGDVPLAELPSLPNDDLRVRAQERLIFLWAMAPIAVKSIARGDPTRAIRQIGLVCDAFVALWRLVDARRPTINGFNQPLEPELARALLRFGSQIGPPDCLVALGHLCADTERRHPRLGAVGVVVPHEMPQQLAHLIADLLLEVERTVAAG